MMRKLHRLALMMAAPVVLTGVVSAKDLVTPTMTERVGAGRFSGGLAPVAVQDTSGDTGARRRMRKPVPLKWGYIDRAGKFVIGARFERAEPFADGLASVLVAGKWGCIDTSGRLVVKPQHEFVGPFSEGLARIVLGGKHGYIDKTGTRIIQPRYDVGWAFSKGLARVAVGDKEGYIDKTGATVWPPRK